MILPQILKTRINTEFFEMQILKFCETYVPNLL